MVPDGWSVCDRLPGTHFFGGIWVGGWEASEEGEKGSGEEVRAWIAFVSALSQQVQTVPSTGLHTLLTRRPCCC